ncbi:MAG: ferrous iron transport protein A [Enterobacterales bacterium]|jgi:ferrous iron transport protein A
MLKINELDEAATIKSDSEENLTLASLAFKQKAMVSSVNSDNSEVLCRLLTLGIYPGVHIEVLRKAPLGDPLQIRSGTTLMSIRLHEATGINVELIK